MNNLLTHPWFAENNRTEIEAFLDQFEKLIDHPRPTKVIHEAFDHAIKLVRSGRLVLPEVGLSIGLPDINPQKHSGLQCPIRPEELDHKIARNWDCACTSLPELTASLSSYPHSEEWSAQLAFGDYRQFVHGIPVSGTKMKNAEKFLGEAARKSFAVAERLLAIQSVMHERYGSRTVNPEWNEHLVEEADSESEDGSIDASPEEILALNEHLARALVHNLKVLAEIEALTGWTVDFDTPSHWAAPFDTKEAYMHERQRLKHEEPKIAAKLAKLEKAIIQPEDLSG